MGLACAIVLGYTPRVKKDPSRVKAGQLGGRPRLYDLSGLEVGKSITLEWRVDARGERSPNQDALHEAVRRESRRLRQTFARVGRPLGLIVTRIA